MKKYRLALALCLLTLFAMNSEAQDKFFTKSGKIYFNCTGGLEKIEATNNSTTCVMDTRSGQVQFAVLMKGFEFEKALMQEHFNENYVESDKFPRSEFKGIITNNGNVNYSKDGEYPVTVQGKLNIHGVVRDIETPGKLVVKSGRINLVSDFDILLSDYHISIPSLVADKIAKSVKLSVDCLLEPLKS